MKHRKTIADVIDKQSLRREFSSKIAAREDGCQIWSGSVGFSGYGQLAFEGRTWSAHRLAYEIANGPIGQDAQKWWVLHKCDNPACCNPDHLYLGDAKDNANDMIDRKRQRMGFKRYGGGEGVRFGRVFYEIGGEIKTLHEWAERLGVNSSTLEQRISAGWPEKDLGLSSRVFKRHLKADGQTQYRRFSGLEEVDNYKSEASVAVTTKASESTNLDGNIDMTSLAITDRTINVPFHGSELYVVNHNGEPYTPMKPIIDGMGMDWASQFTKLKQRFKSTVVEITMVAADGKSRSMICLALRKLAAWLNTISPNKVKPEIRDNVIRYQEECDDVLYEYWTKGQVTNPRKTSTDERTPLRDAINLLVGKRGIMYPEAYSYVHQRFGVSHIEELPSDQLVVAVEYVHRLALEGELMPKEEVKSTTAKQFTDEELVSLCYLQLWMERSQLVSKNLYPAMKQAKSEYAAALYDITHDIHYMTVETKKILLREAQNLDDKNFVVSRAQPMLAKLRGEDGWIH